MKKIVVVGGGTGNFVVLSGLKAYPVDLTAIVSMADDGGSTGVLRDELGVLPPGDVRQCLVALSHSSLLMRDLVAYRFESGGFKGHSFGNLFLSALEKVTGSFEKAVEEMGKILLIKGKVIPVTSNSVRLKMILKNGTILEGERAVYLSEEVDQGYAHIYLEPTPKVNPRALKEIMYADLLVLGPGGLHTSLIPNLLVEKIGEAIRRSKAKKVFVVNLMNRKGCTTAYCASDYLKELCSFIGADVFDYIIVNNAMPPKELMELYAQQGNLVNNDLKDSRVIAAPLLGETKAYAPHDLLRRNLIRHDPESLAFHLMNVIKNL